MAITILVEPMAFWPICNNVEWTFESDNTGQANFSFTVEVYINGGLNSTHQVFPENGDAGKFNISALGRAVLTNNYPDEGIFAQELLTDYQWNLIIYERYGTPAEVQIASAETTSTFRFLNGSFRYENITTGNWNYQDYDLDTGGKGDFFLTDFPRNRKDLVGYSDAKYLSIINSGADDLTGYVSLYNISGTLITSATWTGLLATNLRIPLISVGPKMLVSNTSLVASDFDNCYYYTIQLKQTALPAADSELYRIYYDQSCSPYARKTLHWLNKYGAWDSFTFSLLSEDSSDITSNRYSKRTGQWVGSSYQYDLTDGQQMTVSKSVQDKLILNSDWIHEEVQQWLVRDLYESPRVYLQGNLILDAFEPVNVTNANYLLKQRRKAGLIQEQVQIDRTYTYISQLG